MYATKVFRLVALLILLSLSIGACGAPTQPAVPTEAPQAPAGTKAPAATQAPAATEAQAATEATVATEAPSEGQWKDTIIWARYGDSDTLHPQLATSQLSFQTYDLVYDELVNFDMDMNVVPNLAKKWDISEDGLVYTFYLQEGVLCHNGQELTSEDVKFTFDKAIDPNGRNVLPGLWGPITGAEVVDKYTVKVTLSKPYGAFLSFLTSGGAGIMCKSGYEAAGSDEEFGLHPVGSGPWKFVSWKKGDEIKFERNENYRNFGRPVQNSGPPYTKYLIVKTVPEPLTRLAMLDTGEAALAEPPLEEVPRLQQDPNYKVYTGFNTGQLQYFEFIWSRPPFNEKWGREAFAYAINVPEMLNLVFGDLVQLEGCFAPRGLQGNDEEWCKANGSATYFYDPEKATQILAEHGYGPDKPLEIILISYTGGNRDKVLEVIQQQIAQVGFKATIEMMDIGTLNGRMPVENEKKDGPGIAYNIGNGYWDIQMFSWLFKCPGWVKGWCDPNADKLINEMETLTDQAKRAELSKEVQKIMFDQLVGVPMYTPGWEWLAASKANVEGIVLGPAMRWLFNDVKVPLE